MRKRKNVKKIENVNKKEEKTCPSAIEMAFI